MTKDEGWVPLERQCKCKTTAPSIEMLPQLGGEIVRKGFANVRIVCQCGVPWQIVLAAVEKERGDG